MYSVTDKCATSRCATHIEMHGHTIFVASVVSSCVLEPFCVLYVSKNVGNNIRREENMNTKNVAKIPPPPYYFLSCPNIFCNLNL